MDDIDKAQDRAAIVLEENLARQALRAHLDSAGTKDCTDCGGEIPPERREALPSATRCVDCQAWAERVANLLRRAA